MSAREDMMLEDWHARNGTLEKFLRGDPDCPSPDRDLWHDFWRPRRNERQEMEWNA